MLVLLLSILLAFQPGGLFGQTSQPPDFALKDIRGQTVRLSDYRGKVVLINFWASWCAPCLAEMPELVRLQEEYKDKGLQIIGIAYPKDNPRQVRAVINKLRINYPVLTGTQKVASLFEAEDVLPLSIIIDRQGIVRDRILGMLEPEEFEEKVRPLLQ
ncbi:MAG: TlpA disulfide reductase family protein [Acidobacteriota bacterium]